MAAIKTINRDLYRAKHIDLNGRKFTIQPINVDFEGVEQRNESVRYFVYRSHVIEIPDNLINSGHIIERVPTNKHGYFEHGDSELIAVSGPIDEYQKQLEENVSRGIVNHVALFNVNGSQVDITSN